MARSRTPSGSATFAWFNTRSASRGRQDVLGQAFFHLGHFEFAGRIVERVVVAGAPFEEGPHRHQVRELAAEGQRLAVLLAVVVEPALVAFQQGLGDFAPAA